MKYIYTLLSAILLLVSGATSATAQKNSTPITRTILGCTLGKSTIDEIKAKMTERGAEISQENQESQWVSYIVARGVLFAQAKVDVQFRFFEGNLLSYTVVFKDKGDADRVNLSLIRKYIKGDDLKNIGFEGYGAEDQHTKMYHVYVYSDDYKKEFKYSFLSYLDIALDRKLSDLKASEL